MACTSLSMVLSMSYCVFVIVHLSSMSLGAASKIELAKICITKKTLSPKLVSHWNNSCWLTSSNCYIMMTDNGKQCVMECDIWMRPKRSKTDIYIPKQCMHILMGIHGWNRYVVGCSHPNLEDCHWKYWLVTLVIGVITHLPSYLPCSYCWQNLLTARVGEPILVPSRNPSCSR